MLKLINELAPKAVFDREILHVLTAAFDAAWASLVASGGTFSDTYFVGRAREIIGKYIIQAATNGEQDQGQFCDGASSVGQSRFKKRHKPPESRYTQE